MNTLILETLSILNQKGKCNICIQIMARPLFSWKFLLLNKYIRDCNNRILAGYLSCKIYDLINTRHCLKRCKCINARIAHIVMKNLKLNITAHISINTQ